MENKDPNHKHIYDVKGKQLCCQREERIYEKANAKDILSGKKIVAKQIKEKQEHNHDHNHNHDHEGEDNQHDHGHDHEASEQTVLQMFLPAIISFVLLMTAIVFDHWIHQQWFTGWIRIVWYVVAYIPVGIPVMREAIESIVRGDIFSEFLLMCIATIGAFAIKQYPEAVAVMLFYAVGEVFQTLAIKKAKSNIKSLLDQRPDEVTVLVDNKPELLKAESVNIGSVIQLKPGEKLGLDGELISDNASFNTAALTGESKPDTKRKGETVLAGMINLNNVSLVKVTTPYSDSKLSKILNLVQNATAQKAKTELFIRKFANIYTPIVVILALALCFLPMLFVKEYHFDEWLYRSLIFLVISCPCALVISIPLGYFGGIGAASRNGILFKGSNFLDILAGVKSVVMDKTGTMTKGVFKVQEVNLLQGVNKEKILQWVNALESKSTHPVATAIQQYVGTVDHTIAFSDVEEVSGYGLSAKIEGKQLLVGNFKLLSKYNISFDVDASQIIFTTIAIAYDGKYIGYLTIADELKPDASDAVAKMKSMDIVPVMLSGDKSSVVKAVADKIGVQNYFGDLLPEDKVNKLKEIKTLVGSVAFVGDGVNDAPVVALSDVGIAMGGLGSDATIETADVVIQDDAPSKIPVAINIGKQTKKIVWQNITFAFVVKAIVLILGAGGLATMWEAVFADVGVALLAILNAVRIQRMKF